MHAHTDRIYRNIHTHTEIHACTHRHTFTQTYIYSYIYAECTGWFRVSIWHRLELSQRKELQLEKCLHEIQLWGISSISDQQGRAPCGKYHPWTGSPGFYKRAGWASHGKQANKEQSSMASVSAPASWPAWVPVLTSFGEEQQCGSVSWINPFLPNLFLGHDASCRNRNPKTQTYMYTCIYPDTHTHTYIHIYRFTQTHCICRHTCMHIHMHTKEHTHRHTSSVAHWSYTILLSLSCDSLWRFSSSFYIHLWSWSVMGELITHTSWSCCSDYLRSGHLTWGWMGEILVDDKPCRGSNKDRSMHINTH